MKIAVIIEGSTKIRSLDVENAVKGFDGHEVFNLGMKNTEGEPDLTYMETGLLTALLLNLGAVDFVVGGCGTGQGYMNMVLQFPGIACGLLCDPVDAFLYSQVNAGNCISLALNKGYGNLAGDINVKYILRELFENEYGAGYPDARREIQINARKKLAGVSLAAHKSMEEIIAGIDPSITENALSFPGIADFIKTHAPQSPLKAFVLRRV
ncbi:MAG: RpiB/LacA/LacB family sugar-phosphate isomerase [Oscillospiraceae bacterium]|nr:RpiB/LacA/LacB family sugar-phosphate isomerase [Oscillospiraceae bacterium]